jgi:hypothetical protein
VCFCEFPSRKQIPCCVICVKKFSKKKHEKPKQSFPMQSWGENLLRASHTKFSFFVRRQITFSSSPDEIYVPDEIGKTT